VAPAARGVLDNPAGAEERRVIVLYEWGTCWKCVEVREVLDRVGLEYRTVDIGGNPAARDALVRLSGQPWVPLLVDGATAIWDRRRIIRHLEETYGDGAAGAGPLPGWMGGSRTLAPEELAGVGEEAPARRA
jgi:glutathione S-transferase